MRRALGLMILVLLACGPGNDKPTPGPAGPAVWDSKAAEKDLKALGDHFTWGDTSQPARDWDVDADACEERANEDPGVRRGAHPLVRVGVFVKCMEETGWTFEAKDR